MSEPWRAVVRAYECDFFGHVNNAVYLSYLAEATVRAGGQACAGWQLRGLSIEYHTPALPGDELAVHVWRPPASDPDGVTCAYDVRRAGEGAAIVTAQIVWDAGTTPAATIPAGDAPAPVKPLRLAEPAFAGRPFTWSHTVRYYELDQCGRASSVDLLRWLAEAKFVACAEVGWALEDLPARDLLILQVRHDLSCYGELHAGDEVTVRSWVCEMRKVRGTWRQEVYAGGRLVAADYAGGAFLTVAGRPRTPPAEMVAALSGTG